MSVQPPNEFTGPWPDALQAALEASEPLFVPCTYHCDDRGWSLMNLLTGALDAEGQVNFSMQHPGVVKAWHRHDRQADCWICVQGHLKAGVHREADGATWSIVLGEKRPGVLGIPPPLWHGAATVGSVQCGLFYYVTRSYDAARPDEHRRPWDSVPGFDWSVTNR